MEINEAYEVLSDPAKRREYDRKRHREPPRSQGRQPGSARGRESSKSDRRLVYESDFHHPPAWLEHVGDDSWGFCQDGYLHLGLRAPSEGSTTFVCLGASVGDFQASVEAEFVADTDRRSICGIVFRWEEDKYYVFGVSTHGDYALAIVDNWDWRNLLTPRFSEFLRRGSAANTLTVKAIGSRFELGANGHFITAFEEDTLPDGRAGLLVGTQDYFAEARFRGFRLYSLDTGNYQRAGSQNQDDTEPAEYRNTSRCPNCGAPLSRHYGFAGGEWVRVLTCEECGWSY